MMNARVSEASRPAASERQAARPSRARGSRISNALVFGLVALFIFILALELLKKGAGGIAVLLRGLDVHGMVNTLGFGWLMAYVALCGSPVAAMSLTLLGGGVLTPMETFGMINGSRLGASFIVLFTGFVYFMRGIRGRGVVSMGILAMVTTATIYVPAMLLGAVVLRTGWLSGIRFGSPRVLTSALDVIFDPITGAVAGRLPAVLVFVVGFLCLLLAFRLFDRVLPEMNTDLLETRWGRWLNQPLTMFGLGLLVTLFTLSVSVSLSVLVPLAGRGYVRRYQVVPYIMGANISTFVDTLFASLLIPAPVAFTLVLTEMISVAVVSVIVLFAFFGPYQRALLEFNRGVTTKRRRFMVFVACLAVVPVALLLA